VEVIGLADPHRTLHPWCAQMQKAHIAVVNVVDLGQFALRDKRAESLGLFFGEKNPYRNCHNANDETVNEFR